MRCTNKLQADRLAMLEALASEDKGAARLKWDMGSAFLVNDTTWDKMYVQISDFLTKIFLSSFASINYIFPT